MVVGNKLVLNLGIRVYRLLHRMPTESPQQASCAQCTQRQWQNTRREQGDHEQRKGLDRDQYGKGSVLGMSEIRCWGMLARALQMWP